MAHVSVLNAQFTNANPSPLTTPFVLEVKFRCVVPLEHPLVWKLIYVGSPESKEYDQELERIELGNLKKGVLKFQFEAGTPDFSLIPNENIFGATVILLEAMYNNQEFVRIGWYINNQYVDPILNDDPPEIADIMQMSRYIITDQPRITKFNICWETNSAVNSFDYTNAASTDTSSHVETIDVSQLQEQCTVGSQSHQDANSSDNSMCDG